MANSPKQWCVLLLVVLWGRNSVIADPQTNLLNQGCSQYKPSNLTVFYSNLNATFSDLSSQISKSNSTRFVTDQSHRTISPVYALFQCRDYLSTSDCSTCLSVAISAIRNCSGANGARVIYDGCFLRYESTGFFDVAVQDGSVALCGNITTRLAGFASAVNSVLSDLTTAVPLINGFFAAVERTAAGVYAAAQCIETVTQVGCSDCLNKAYNSIKGCSPSTDGRAADAGCFMRYSSTPFFLANQTVDLAPFLTAASASSSGGSSKGAIIGGVVGGVGGFLLLGLLFLLWIQRSRKAASTQRGDILGATELRGPIDFSYKDLKAATRNFKIENKLGEGGFGDVFKGVLKNGNIVAVKRLAISKSNRVKSSFLTEVKLISNVHHRNLVRLLGCSSRGPDLLLVYEFMANGSLDRFLYGERQGTLSWKQRFDIIVGMARGLAYLHEEFHQCIIHRDIKSSNILLDDNFQPKIADFGLARLLPEEQSHLITKFAGTLGYTAPEYAIHGQLSEKVDTYSYGVVVLEIISGRKCNDISLEPVTQYLLEWAWKLYEEGLLIDLVDGTLDPEQYVREEVAKVIEIALLCTQSAVVERPTMSEVVVMLLGRNRPQLQPARPTFIDSTKRIRGDTSTSSGSSFASNANLSITQISIR